jgi:multidrug resistance efflux pump
MLRMSAAVGGPRWAVFPRPQLKHRPPPQAFVLLALVLGGLVWWAYDTWRAALPPGPLAASGTVEADEVLVGSEVAARVVTLRVDEGRTVSAGDALARLDDSLLQLQLSQADAASRRQLELQADRYVLKAPIGGVVTRVLVRAGEVVSPGQTVAAVSDLSKLKLTLYVLERDLGRVRVGQPVQVTADPFPGRVFDGTVTSINTRAEFTPRNVQTQRDRLNLVFGVKLRVDNPDGALKAGMPVDAVFVGE